MQPSPAPIPPTADQTPEAYIVWKTQCHCRTCNTFSEHCELWSQYPMRGAWGFRTASNLRPLVGQPLYNLPIIIKTRPMQNLPFCHICAPEVTLSHLPSPPRHDTGRIMNGIASREATEGRSLNTSERTTKRPPTLADLNF